MSPNLWRFSELINNVFFTSLTCLWWIELQHKYKYKYIRTYQERFLNFTGNWAERHRWENASYINICICIYIYKNLTSWFIFAFNCRWSQLPLFWTSKPCSINHVSNIRLFMLWLNYCHSFNSIAIHRSKVVSSQTVPAFGSKYICFLFSSTALNSTLASCCCLVSLSHCGYWLSHFSESKSLRDEEILQTLPVGTTASFYFSDLGAQLTWGTVSPHPHRHKILREKHSLVACFSPINDMLCVLYIAASYSLTYARYFRVNISVYWAWKEFVK